MANHNAPVKGHERIETSNQGYFVCSITQSTSGLGA